MHIFKTKNFNDKTITIKNENCIDQNILQHKE